MTNHRNVSVTALAGATAAPDTGRWSAIALGVTQHNVVLRIVNREAFEVWSDYQKET